MPVLRRHPRRPSFFKASPSRTALGSPDRPGGILLLAAVDQAVEKSSCSDDYGWRADGAAVAEFDANDAAGDSNSHFRLSLSG